MTDQTARCRSNCAETRSQLRDCSCAPHSVAGQLPTACACELSIALDVCGQSKCLLVCLSTCCPCYCLPFKSQFQDKQRSHLFWPMIKQAGDQTGDEAQTWKPPACIQKRVTAGHRVPFPLCLPRFRFPENLAYFFCQFIQYEKIVNLSIDEEAQDSL